MGMTGWGFGYLLEMVDLKIVKMKWMEQDHIFSTR